MAQYYQLSFWTFLVAPLVFFSICSFATTPEIFRLEFKQLIIQKIIHQIKGVTSYNALRFIPRHEIERSKILHRRINFLTGEDYIAGKVDKTDFYMSEILAQFINKDKKNGLEWKQKVFQGVFFVADFHKDFKSHTFVFPEKVKYGFGFFVKKFQNLNFLTPPLVRLENPQFEREFAVHSNNQTETRYILSSIMMENLLEIQKKFNKKLRITFVDSKIYIAIPMQKNWLEPNFWTTLKKPTELEKYYDTLKLMIEIIEDLNLNRRIWTKE